MPQQNEIKQDRTWTEGSLQLLERGEKFIEMSTRKSCLKQGKLGKGYGNKQNQGSWSVRQQGQSANPKEGRVCPEGKTGCGDSVGLNPRNKQLWDSSATHWASLSKVHSVSCSLSHILPLFINLITQQ